MDAVDFLQKQVDKWNEDEKCDLCFEFSAPMTESKMNIVQSDLPCCVQVMLTKLSTNTNNIYNSITGLLVSSSCDYSITFYVLKQSNLGVNNYNEIKGHNVKESKWNTIFKPLQDCFSCQSQLDFCELLGLNVEVKKWQMDTVHNYQDNNFDGWKIQATLRITD